MNTANTSRLERRFEEIQREAEGRKFHEEFACEKCMWGKRRECTNALVTGFDGAVFNVDKLISMYGELYGTYILN